MTQTSHQMRAAHHDRLQRFWIVSGLVLACLWADLFLSLSQEWRVNEQYSFGFLVPFLGLYLLFLRWETRPRAWPPARAVRWSADSAALLLILALFPIRMVLEANPDWRFMMWLQALTVFLVTLLVLWRAGGVRWALFFLPALLFFLFSVPWPTRLENPLVQGLMRMVAEVCVEVLNLMGITAIQQGNLIRLPNALVGVEEACSGVRSFQSALMAAYFFGEFYRVALLSRLGLLVVAAALSILLNLARSLTLTLVAHWDSPAAMERWHDPLGYTVFFGTFALVFGASFLIAKLHPAHGQSGEERMGDPGAAPLPIPLGVLGLIGLLWAGGIVATEGYYRLRSTSHVMSVTASPQFDRIPASIHFPELAPQIRSLLRYSEGVQAVWSRHPLTWTVFHFTWDSGAVSSFSGVHRPEICLQAAGLVLTERGNDLVWEQDGFQMVMETYTFRSGRSDYHVFFSVWEVKNGRPIRADQAATDRFGAVRQGIRFPARQSLQLVIQGSPNLEAATQEARSFLSDVMTVAVEFP